MVGAYASESYWNIEGYGAHGSPAGHCDYSVGNRISGSVESNGCGGFWIHQRCTGMEFDRMHCEANGADGDYIVNSSFNTFRRCNAASPVRSQIYGSYNDFQSGSLSGMQIFAGATKNRFAMNNNLAT